MIIFCISGYEREDSSADEVDVDSSGKLCYLTISLYLFIKMLSIFYMPSNYVIAFLLPIYFGFVLLSQYSSPVAVFLQKRILFARL